MERMNFAKRVILLVLCGAMMAGLFGCGSSTAGTQPSTAATEAPIETTEAVPETTAAAFAETTSPTEAPVVYTNPLTGEISDTPFDTRIFTCTISNVSSALPMWGVMDCDIFWEMLINGGATRGLAMFADVASAGELGSLRSARIPFVDICEAYDAILAYSGGSDYVLAKIYNCGIAHLPDTGWYYRHPDRVGANYDFEHCLSTNGPDLLAYAQDMGYRTTTERDGYGLNFTEGATPDGEDANVINYWFWSNLRTMTYNPETGLYEYTIYGEDCYDYFTDERIGFKNVLLLDMFVYNEEIYHVSDIDGSGTGYYACNGKIVPILWEHEDEYEPFTFYLEDGTPLEMDIGTSYIGFVPEEDPISWE